MIKSNSGREEGEDRIYFSESFSFRFLILPFSSFFGTRRRQQILICPFALLPCASKWERKARWEGWAAELNSEWARAGGGKVKRLRSLRFVRGLLSMSSPFSPANSHDAKKRKGEGGKRSVASSASKNAQIRRTDREETDRTERVEVVGGPVRAAGGLRRRRTSI